MADNTTLNTMSGGDVIATDDVTTLNGSASSGVKVQRVKVMYGDENSATDASATNPLPVNSAGVSTSGNITAVNASPSSGAGTANSSVALTLNGATGVAFDVRGTFTATLSFQGTIDGTNWFTLTAVAAGGGQNSAATTSATSAGVWTAPCGGFVQARMTATAYTSGTATVTVRATTTSIVHSMPTMASNQSTALAAGSNAIGYAGTQGPIITADVASAALSSTTTTSAFSSVSAAYQVNIPVTAVSGTNPTLDVVVQESDDTGTNWFDVYYFPRITATGMYRSPMMLFTGNRVRYVQTIGGTASPSFTRAINRLQGSLAAPLVRGLIDRSIAPNTLNSASSAITTDGCTTYTLTVVSGSGATVSPIYGIQISDDSSSWADTGVSLTVAASVTVTTSISGIVGRFARIYIKSAGTGATQTYAALRAVG